MKVLCFIDDLGAGGAQRQLVYLGKELKKNGYDVTFLVYHPNNFYEEELLSAGITITKIFCDSYLLRLYRIRKFISKNRFKCVIAFLQGPSFIATIANLPFKRFKIIVGERSANPSIVRDFKAKFYRFFHLSVDYVVANSYLNLSMVQKVNPFLKKEKCLVIYNCIDKADFVIDEKFNFRKDKYLKIVIGASHRNVKNLNFLVDAFSKLSLETKECFRFFWYGDRLTPPYFDSSYLEAQERIEKYNLAQYFNFYPASRDFKNVIKDADIVGLFSQYEGQPNVICEAMSKGKPIISSKVGDLEKILGKDNKQLFTVNDFESFKSVFLSYSKLTQEELLNLGRNNFDLAIEVFDSKKIIDSYVKIIQN